MAVAARDYSRKTTRGQASSRDAFRTAVWPLLNDIDRDRKLTEEPGMKFVMKSGTMLVVAAALVTLAPMAKADDTTLEISVKDHKFEPAEVKAAAGSAIVFKVKNLDAGPVEFESEPLQFETVVKPNAELLVKVKPQKPGRYVFFDDLHQETKGTLVVE
jgi:plastocyanin